MSENTQNLDLEYMVVINGDEQYSIWLSSKKEPPNGWKTVGFKGTKSNCLNYIKSVWTDMRPRSARTSQIQKTQ